MPERLPAAVAGIDPRGWLVFAAPLPAELQRAEDATADADRRRWPHATDGGWCASLWAGAVDPDDMVRARRLVGGLMKTPGVRRFWAFARPATPTERLLLETLGFAAPTDELLVTVVDFPSVGVRSRRWPQLEAENP
ncbi:hypothetical protein PJK45_04850 [Mycobacterium kansasii]|uniref:hypothetical protein n=1 Tax=Mycobacterium kansasii TaxID=1768 RepID=UPI00115A2682|nr:hypothetical protein [Mycobacterium kansasii]MXO38761.1 hypothetical protein [Mycobacterium kansasii]